jgi:general secretion pathway protein K
MKSKPHRGAALLTALVIVTLVASLAAAMVWRQYRAVNIEAADRARTQAGWVLLGGLDWARLILVEDARANQREPIDHLGEVWAVPLAESRLSTFLAAEQGVATSDDGPEAFLSGTIEDAQARYNLFNAVQGKEPDPVEQKTVERLSDAAGLSRSSTQAWLGQLRRAAQAGTDSEDAPLRARRLEQLAWYGVEPEVRAKLEPWVILLPSSGTRLNLNTAPREVLAAAAEGMNLALAERLVQTRRNRPFRSLDEVKALLPEPLPAAFSDKRFSVTSDHFLVTGRLRLEERVMVQRSLVQRRGNQVTVLQRERVSSFVEGGGTGRPLLTAP